MASKKMKKALMLGLGIAAGAKMMGARNKALLAKQKMVRVVQLITLQKKQNQPILKIKLLVPLKKYTKKISI